jgi:LysM repeat protein
MLKRINYLVYFFLFFLSAGCVTVPRQIAPQAGPFGVYHIVGSGQTLWRIAKTYGVDIKEIMRSNRITDPNQLGVGQELFIPGARTLQSIERYKPAISESIEKIVGPKRYSSRWRSITLHHSATLEGNAEVFDRNHRKRRMGGLFYHFVIGNGTGSALGEIEVGWRWRRQAQVNRPGDIQICLVGDFNRQKASGVQTDSLIKLIAILRRQYNIPLSNIRKHKDVTNRATECPGGNFPFAKIIAELRKIKS